MQVRKRNGLLEPVNVAKIVSSLQRYCDLPNVDVYRIATKTINGLVDNVSTLELDLLSVRTAKDLIIDDPIYAKVAARILANIIQKEVSSQDIQSFSQSIELGAQQGLIGQAAYDLVMANKRKLNAAVKHDRDWHFEYHGLQTVYDRYLLKHPTLLNADRSTGKKQRAVIETPQYFMMRVACGLAVDAAEAVEMYNLLSSLEYMCSSPTLFNSGTTHSQMSSCFVAGTNVVTVNDGPKAIEAVEIGDTVVTHKGRIKPVTQLHRNPRGDRPLYEASCSNGARFIATGDHRFWSVSDKQMASDDLRPAWMRIDELQVGDWIATPSLLDNLGTYDELAYVRLTGKTISSRLDEVVYTLGVEDDHSYPVEGVLCENCYLLDSPLDSLDDIYKRYADVAMLSKFAGGIGASMSRIRSKGTLIKGTNGQSNGITPWAHTLSGSVAAVNQCLHPETSIQTSRGLVPIKEVIQGDLVLTHTGRYRLVEEVLRYNASTERMLEIRVHGSTTSMKITTGHPVLAFRSLVPETHGADLYHWLERGFVRPDWVEAQDLRTGDYVGIPAPADDSAETPQRLRFDGKRWMQIETVVEIATPDTVYDLRVDFDHTYAGSAAIYHNGGKRKGAAAIYLETHHPDIMQFLEMRDNTGEKESRAYNLNLANWMSDLFMKRVKEDAIWSLFDPVVAPELNDLYGEAYERRYIELEAQEKFTEQLPARKVYARMMRTLAETGNGWVCFKDTCNRRANQVNDDEKTIVHLSNLCVAPETLILTRSGYTPIVDLAETAVEVWNGSEWSETVVRQTGVNQPLLTVTLSNGLEVDCTPYHKFYVINGYRGGYREVRACELQAGDKLIKFDLPVLEEGTIEFPFAYTHGFFCGDGTYNTKAGVTRPHVTLYAEKKQLASVLETIGGTNIEDAGGRLNYRLPLDMPAKFAVPSAQHTLASRIEWLCGLADADGCATMVGTCQGLQIASIHKGFLRSVSLMLQSLGIHSHIGKVCDAGTVQVRPSEKFYPTQPLYRLVIASAGVNTLLAMGAKFERLKLSHSPSDRDARHFAKVISVENRGRTDDTFCFTEPKRHMGMFNGILTGQCSEIVEVTSSGERKQMSRETVSALSSEDMVEQNISVVGFDTTTDQFEVLQGAEVAVCLAAGSQILTDDGYQSIEACDGANVLVPFYNDYLFEDAPRFIKATLIDNGVQPVWNIRLSNGCSVRATASHKFLAGRAASPQDWVTVEAMDAGMTLAAFGPMHDDEAVTVSAIIPAGVEQVYDLYVPQAHHFIVAGVVSHNCNLGSINIGRGYVRNGKLDIDKLHRNVAIAVKYLDRVIDRNYYPIPEAKASNMRWRPIGLGLMGLADFFFQMHIAFDSQQAVALSSDIQEEIYYQALRTSCDLAKQVGPHRDFHLTRAAKGHLQFDLAGVVPKNTERWDALRADIMEHGLRNSLLLAGAPTACQVGTNAIQTAEGVFSLYEILERNGIAYDALEAANVQQWLAIAPLMVETMQGPKVANKVWFNGHQPTFKITYEDGSFYEYTANHRLLVVRDGVETWTEVQNLRPDDDIRVK